MVYKVTEALHLCATVVGQFTVEQKIFIKGVVCKPNGVLRAAAWIG